MRLLNFIISALGFVMLVLIAIIIFNNFNEGENTYNAAELLLNGLVRIINDFEDEGGTYYFAGTLEKNVYLSVFNEGQEPLPKSCKNRVPCICICHGENGVCENVEDFPAIKCKSKFGKDINIKLARCGTADSPSPPSNCDYTKLYNLKGGSSSQSHLYSVVFDGGNVEVIEGGVEGVDSPQVSGGGVSSAYLNQLKDVIDENTNNVAFGFDLPVDFFLSAFNSPNHNDHLPNSCEGTPCICVCKKEGNEQCISSIELFNALECLTFDDSLTIVLPRCGVGHNDQKATGSQSGGCRKEDLSNIMGGTDLGKGHSSGSYSIRIENDVVHVVDTDPGHLRNPRLHYEKVFKLFDHIKYRISGGDALPLKVEVEKDVYLSVFQRSDDRAYSDHLPQLCGGKAPCLCVCKGGAGKQCEFVNAEGHSGFNALECSSFDSSLEITLPRYGDEKDGEEDEELYNIKGNGEETYTVNIYDSTVEVTVGDRVDSPQVSGGGVSSAYLNQLKDVIDENTNNVAFGFDLPVDFFLSAFNSPNHNDHLPNSCEGTPCICVCKKEGNEQCISSIELFNALECLTFDDSLTIVLPRCGVGHNDQKATGSQSGGCRKEDLSNIMGGTDLGKGHSSGSYSIRIENDVVHVVDTDPGHLRNPRLHYEKVFKLFDHIKYRISGGDALPLKVEVEKDVYLSVFQRSDDRAYSDHLPQLCGGKAPCLCVCKGGAGKQCEFVNAEGHSGFNALECSSFDSSLEITLPRYGDEKDGEEDEELYNIKGNGEETYTVNIYDSTVEVRT